MNDDPEVKELYERFKELCTRLEVFREIYRQLHTAVVPQAWVVVTARVVSWPFISVPRTGDVQQAALDAGTKLSALHEQEEPIHSMKLLWCADPNKFSYILVSDLWDQTETGMVVHREFGSAHKAAAH